MSYNDVYLVTFYRLVKCSNVLDYQSIQQFDNYAHITLLGSALSIYHIVPAGMSWMINSGQGLLPMAGVRTGTLGFGADQTAQYFQVCNFSL